MFNIALRWTWNEAEAQELVQDTFVKVWHKRQTVEVTSLRPYLYKTLLNLAQNHARKRERWNRVQRLLGIKEPQTPHQSEKQLEHRDLKRAIEQLPAGYRQTLLLCEFSDLKQHEIAELLNIDRSTVASRRGQAIKLLKKELNHD